MPSRFPSSHHKVEAASVAKSNPAISGAAVEAAGQADVAPGPPEGVRVFGSLRRWLRAHRSLQLFVVVLFAIVLFGATSDEPFHLDNMDFPAAAKRASI